MGAPTDAGLANSICSALSGDPFSERVNYLTSATFTQPAFVQRKSTLTFTTFAERRSEYKAFERNGVGGSVALGYALSRASQVTLTYRMDYGSTKADQAVFCVYFDRCQQAAVDVLSQPRREASLSLALVRNTANSPLEPTAGSVLLLRGLARLAAGGLRAPDLVQQGRGRGHLVRRVVARRSSWRCGSGAA